MNETNENTQPEISDFDRQMLAAADAKMELEIAAAKARFHHEIPLPPKHTKAELELLRARDKRLAELDVRLFLKNAFNRKSGLPTETALDLEREAAEHIEGERWRKPHLTK